MKYIEPYVYVKYIKTYIYAKYIDSVMFHLFLLPDLQNVRAAAHICGGRFSSRRQVWFGSWLGVVDHWIIPA